MRRGEGELARRIARPEGRHPVRLVRLLPREESFFDLFNRSAQNALEAARALAALMDDIHDAALRAAAIKELEDRGDELTHAIIDRLNRTFVTPFDREDILGLATQIDNVVDWIEAAAARLADYGVTAMRPEARQLAHIIVSICEAVVEAVAALRGGNRISGASREINRLENLADRVQRQAVGRLFREETNAIEVMKWKEIIETLEEATDQGEDVANVLETIHTKNL
jgi:predicted phosphate transport protein (TIGR00153 family)